MGERAAKEQIKRLIISSDVEINLRFIIVFKIITESLNLLWNSYTSY